MQFFPPTLILRHRKENLKKCSLRGLEKRQDFVFFDYPGEPLPPLQEYILLTIDAPPLQPHENGHGLLLLDGTWRYAAAMEKWVEQQELPLIHRSIPSECRTAYPRCQTSCAFPDQGLASIEALYIAYLILNRDVSELLDNYYWKADFLNRNQQIFDSIKNNI